ncbi:LAETG motif-containing sortase-dependent surface protein [Streptomyces iconiensis]|uniref:LAETG motif-containing sortase-dependent surface protein n=1 Tax=Streptomyces iconiensis TaxID=1384038 RepID=A0ABT7A3M6_9ACTN|nr:LAETG motif-containing sortase-dependent surface protein [Streptomyces iconiensis]MDJ1135948.1 LAETG motif-containing sortase-dependent surface protein [Streptomyces iconiensis]
MKLCRVYATVATTAVLAPAALLAAPAAYAAHAAHAAHADTVSVAAGKPSATGGPPEAPVPSTAPSGPAPTPGGPGTAPGEKPDEPASGRPDAGTGEQPGEAAEGPSQESGAGEKTGEPSEPQDGTGPTEETEHADDTEGTGGTEGTGDAEGAENADECADDEIAEDPELSTTLNGLPSKVVAGSGYHAFTYEVVNSSDRAYKRVDFGLFAGTVHGEDLEHTGRHLTLQFKDPATGDWEPISTDDHDEDAGYVGFTDVRPHETVSLDLRLDVAKEAPDGLGFALSLGAYVDENGACYLSTGGYYEFDVLKASARPGRIPSAAPRNHAPQGVAKKPLRVKPMGDRKFSPTGRLAETGSSDVLPLFALAGAAAVALGAGAVFAVRRRRTDGARV